MSLASLLSRATARPARFFAFGETARPRSPALSAKTGCAQRLDRARPLAAPSGRAPRSLTSYGIPPAHLRLRRNRTGSIASSSRRAGGFTLLELLLAFVVFALSFAAVLEILSGSMRNTVRAREYTEAALTAQSIMDQVGLEIPLQAGFSAAGEVGSYRWEIDLFDYVDTGENPYSVELAELTGIQLLEVELLVSWGESPREQTSRFSTVKAILADRDQRRR